MKKSKLILFISIFLFNLGALFQASAQVEEIESKSTLYYYSGTLGTSQKVEFNLQLNDYLVSGSYIMERTGDMYVFTGRMAQDRKGMGVLVYDENDIYIGSIEANIITENNNFGKLISGNLKSASGSKTQALRLKKVAEFAQAQPFEAPADNMLGD